MKIIIYWICFMFLFMQDVFGAEMEIDYLEESRAEKSTLIQKSARLSDRVKRNRRRKLRGFSLWIDEQQVKRFSGYLMPIYVFSNSQVMPYLLDPEFEKELPVIPSEVDQVNFTWNSGRKKYFYEFYNLHSENTSIVKVPSVSIKHKGRIPKRTKQFSIKIECVKNASGIGSFKLGLKIWRRIHKGRSGREQLEDTPLTLHLKKECILLGSGDPMCDEKCGANGHCDAKKNCHCRDGYMGASCETSICYPPCRNGGICSAPGICSCHSGYQGRHCEGGMCLDKCLNGGQCIQKDTCSCKKGFYGNRCEYSKCVIPCINGGRCRGVNKCKCLRGYSGDHCQIINNKKLARKLKRCQRKCGNGDCTPIGKCNCVAKYSGKWCKKRRTG